ncbi:ThiF family adenylyltransferase, partial [Methylophilaceae bacterium]|nr:ThiF family adenylyltransferase [Methylophilaceae bacterium]
MTVDIERRFSGIIRLFGKDRFKIFQDSHVCVVGIGGVGSWVVESLVRHGVGTLTLIDMDHIAESNINRQIHALDKTLGASKVDTMRKRILSINPEVNIICIDDFLSQENISEYILKSHNFVIDAIDQTLVKISLAEYCLEQDIQFLMTGGAGGKKDPSKIKLTDLRKTYGDPLLSRIRQYFNKKNSTKASIHKIPTIFSDEPIIKPIVCE